MRLSSSPSRLPLSITSLKYIKKKREGRFLSFLLFGSWPVPFQIICSDSVHSDKTQREIESVMARTEAVDDTSCVLHLSMTLCFTTRSSITCVLCIPFLTLSVCPACLVLLCSVCILFLFFILTSENLFFFFWLVHAMRAPCHNTNNST